MNFMEAVKAMKEGKKVRRKEWELKSYYVEKEFHLIRGSNSDAVFHIDDYEATDWEIGK